MTCVHSEGRRLKGMISYSLHDCQPVHQAKLVTPCLNTFRLAKHGLTGIVLHSFYLHPAFIYVFCLFFSNSLRMQSLVGGNAFFFTLVLCLVNT